MVLFDSVHLDRARIPEFQFSFLIFLLAFIIAGCSTDSAETPPLSLSGQFFDLEFTEQEVYKVEVKDNTLFAGTSDGFMVLTWKMEYKPDITNRKAGYEHS